MSDNVRPLRPRPTTPKQEGADSAWKEVEGPAKAARPAGFGKPKSMSTRDAILDRLDALASKLAKPVLAVVVDDDSDEGGAL